MKLLIAAVLLVSVGVHARPQQPAPVIQILKYSQQQDPAGYYSFSFETENGIQATEDGTVIRPGTDSESTAKQGSFSYPGPDGVYYSVSYVADDNGFRASGAHLPTPPPIPADILESLKENERDGNEFDEQGFLKKKKRQVQ
ncbi:Endocuticle structural glycoprotein SgAbd-2 [Frankliniella fusca]|uniref:Endocuticle structural glycoprotein SgAbd-2 n=1 Tax=Frankliniella fusca TaxID=407009 RepID=A0AAE1LKA0_9NEOP|nr:Endocuticle structural glycoprotein SgAbd-2 [Frankliniella fusca]